ncbi:type I-E CRISPR-associated endoribonuclease Cas2e [Thermus neutrinimicus]|uniref:type I-E CRISPR-associated endoribonuclease Cas2e n=1 Tax=Thermus neutrinimicus TaxID=2908149 RepID=UPI001FAA28FC|nr:type I-E CRISPR-associated endoribonuclease Cas2e [Thermus neutrinimicus]
MVVLILEKVPRSLRGELTRWLLELDTGVFVGRVSATVRDLLWQKVVEKAGEGRCAMAWRANNEQGFSLRLHGYQDRTLRDFDGIVLVSVRNAEAMRKAKKLRALMRKDEPEAGQASTGGS